MNTLGGTATLVAIWLLVGSIALLNREHAPSTPAGAEDGLLGSSLTAQFEAALAAHRATEFSLLLRLSEPILGGADALDRRAFAVTGGTVTDVRRLDGRSDRWELGIAPDGRSGVRVRLLADPGCGGANPICTQHLVPLSNRPEATVPGPPVTAAFLDAVDHHSGLDSVTVRIGLSEPIAASARAFHDLALRVSGGSIERVHRAGSDGGLWEVVLIPESTDDLVLGLAPPSDCANADLDCLNLRRIAEPSTLTIPPATIHLTFDDGPSQVDTPIILDILKQHDARATFFVVGRSAVSFPELIERIVSEGHTLANHTWAHDDLLSLGDEEFDRTLLRTQAALGEHATPCFRPPNYRFDEDTVRRARELGLRMILNTGDTGDWLRLRADEIAARIVAAARPGAILVLHDGGGDRSQTIEALGSALAWLSDKRYVFEPVCE